MKTRFVSLAAFILTATAILAPQGVTRSSFVPDGFGVNFAGIEGTEAEGMHSGSRLQSTDVTVYITRTGAKYHRSGCRSLAKSSIPIFLKDAVGKGYGACGMCNPPRLNASPQPPTEASIPALSVPSSKAIPTNNADIIVYGTKTGSRYHRAGCSSLARSSIPMSIKAAKAKGLGPCSLCKPPLLP
jgi:hypothetical protein